MENFNSEWAVESTDLKEFKSEYVETDDEEKSFEQDENSQEVSGEESGDDSNSKNDSEISLNKFKNVALAKKRLQAYTNKAHLQKVSIKNKNEECDKSDKNLLKKSKKDYPDDRAKAVIQEIEELKKKEAIIVAQETHVEQLKHEFLSKQVIAAAIKNIKNLATNMNRARSRSVSSERDRQFKKREIKSRNYRRTDSYERRSKSPVDRSRKSANKSTSSKRSYPKNWQEYTEENLTQAKDEELKSKLFKQHTTSNLEMYFKLYNCDAPSHFVVPFKYSADNEVKEVPLFHFRVTRSLPKITFCTNYQKDKESFITRSQLYNIIPSARKQLIEKLINSSGKYHSTAKPLETRAWYNKLWRKKDAECKVLENSVGLSFLQTYSDEEEEVDNEEIVICSSTKSNPKKEPVVSISDIKEMQDKLHSNIESTLEESQVDAAREETSNVELEEPGDLGRVETPEVETTEAKTNEENDVECEPGEIMDETDKVQEDEKEYTPEKELLFHKIAKEETLKTKKVIRMLEKELAKRSDICVEETNEKKTKSKHKDQDEQSKEKHRDGKKKKKSSKKNEETVDSNSEDENPKSKKKKKKSKLKKQDADDEDVSEDDRKAAKSKKKDQKKEKLKKKLSKKESKTKEEVLQESKRDRKKKKKKASPEDDVSEEKETSRKKKRKKAKKKRDESRSSASSDEYDDEKQTKSSKSKTKKLKKKKLQIDAEISSEDRGKVSEVEKKRDKSVSYKKLESSLDRGRRTSESSSGRIIEYTDLRQKLVAKSGKMKKGKLQKKTVDYEEKRKSFDKVISPENRNDLRWELLENKRKRRHEEEIEEFPLEKDIFTNSSSQVKESNTPDTDEYLPNWEKDSDAVWESEDDVPPKPKEKLNSSWESDEETFERTRVPTDIRSFKDSLDLEIPLNIKPFKRRPDPVLSSDTDFEMFEIEGKNLREERRRLEIEKLKVNQLELRVFNEIENKKSLGEHCGVTPLPNTEKAMNDVDEEAALNREKPTKNVLIDLDKIQEKAKQEISKPKRDRWDQKIAASSTPIKKSVDLTVTTPEKTLERDDTIVISSSTETNDTSAVLENEYEQFMKAVCSNVPEKKENITIDVVTKPDTPSLISPGDISFIPMPNEIKPVPVPSPKLEAEKIPNPLINVSLSANITLDITSKIDSPSGKSLSVISSPVPTMHLAPVSKTEALVSSSTVDIKPLIKKTEEIEDKLPVAKLEVPKVESPKDEVIKSSANIKKIDATKPLFFGGMTIPTKKTLLSNSNLKLGDSDEEEVTDKPVRMRQIDDIKKENSLQEDTLVFKIQQHAEIKSYDSSDIQPPENLVQKRSRSKSPLAPRYADVKQARRESPPKKIAATRYSSPLRSRRSNSPARKRNSPSRRHMSPRRSPRRRLSPRRSLERRSPIRSRRSPARRSSPGRRSPGRRSPTGKRRYSSRRSKSPSYRRRRESISPRRRLPRRSPSPRPTSAKRPRSRSPEKPYGLWKSPEHEKRSRGSAASPLERLKRSVADSTISDDLLPQAGHNPDDLLPQAGHNPDGLLPQASHNPDDYVSSPVRDFYDATMKMPDFTKQPPKTVNVSYDSYSYDESNFPHMDQYMNPVKNEADAQSIFDNIKTATTQQGFVQMGNMVQIVPRDLDMKTEPNGSQRPKTEMIVTVPHIEKSQIVQVGNIVQIVPTDFSLEMIKPLDPPLPPEPPPLPLEEPKEEIMKRELSPTLPPLQEKQSAEEAMKIKTAERMAEREKRRQEKEKKRQEKEKRRKEREAKRQLRMNQKTENMIKRALQLEVAAMAEDESEGSAASWLSVPVVSGISKYVGKSILIKGGFSSTSTKSDKNVKFADGVRPGEGTSPSGGEELSSPPPKKVLPKEKRYTKTKLKNKSPKKKVKVKVIKKTPVPPPDDDDEDDHLPPPSPPPGSPPPHLFPPRMKTTMINNIHPSFVLAVQSTPPVPVPTVTVATSQAVNQYSQQQLQLQEQQLHQQQPQLYNPTVGLLMAPPPPPPHHHHHPGPPPPHHHHGPPHHGPPPMPPHHGPPPMPPHHGPPMPPHHGPPLPPGPPGHHHGPPLPGPPGPPHHRPPYHF